MIGLLLGLTVYAVSIGRWPVAIVIAAGAVLFAMWLGRRWLFVGVLALAAAWWITASLPPPIAVSVPAEQGWRLTVTSMPQLRQRGWSFTARIQEGDAAGQSLLVYTSDPESLLHGDEIYGYGTIERREEITESYGSYLDGRGVSGQIYLGAIDVDRRGSGVLAAINRIRQDTIERLVNAAPGDAGALLAGFVTGDDGQLSDQSDSAFKRAGLSHLTAVSGANLGMMVAMVAAAGRATARRRTSWIIAGAGVAWIYAIFVGLSPPTFRAALLTTAIAGGRLTGRPIDMLSLSFVTAAVQIALRPTDAYSISFQLSTAASIGLAAGLNRYPPGNRRLQLTDLVFVTICAQVATLPFIAVTFRDVPLLSILANIVAVPLAMFAFPVAVFGSALLWVSPGLGAALLIPATWAANGVLGVAQLFDADWSVIHAPPVGSLWLGAGLVTAFTILLHAGGDLKLLRRQFAILRGKWRDNG